jgi:N6-adenosine-specific RNA methylase IME4
VTSLRTKLGTLAQDGDALSLLQSLPDIRAGAIMADPAFRFATRSAKGQGRAPSRHYDDMTVEEIMALPVSECAGDDCFLFLWLPNPHIRLLEPIMSAWGFQFSGSAFAWVKTTKNAVVTPLSVTAASGAKTPWHTGLGYTTRKNIELCWLGRRGNPKRLDRGVRELIIAPVREHSRKPDEQYGRIESFCVGPFLELFARQRRPGWAAWGNQVGLFDRGAA